MKVTLDIPDSYALYFSLKTIEAEFLLNSALMLYKQGRLSVSKASELAGIGLYEFLKKCKENDIPVIDYSPEELTQEFTDLKKAMI